MAQHHGGDTELVAKPSGVGKKNSIADDLKHRRQNAVEVVALPLVMLKRVALVRVLAFLKGGREVTDSHAHFCDARAELVSVDKEKRRNEVEKLSLDMRLHLINRCFDFVAKHPNMSKECIVKMVPAFAAIIDEMMDN